MVSFDPFTMNIVLTAAVAGLFIFFITLLIKLNPSAEKKKDFETEIEIEEQQPSIIVSEHLQPQPESARIEVPKTAESPRATEKPIIAVAPTMGGASIQTKQEAPTLSQGREIPKPPEKTETPTPAKTGFVPTKKDCLHHFGYLRTFPKNSPIPDECFGCEKIVDCLVNNKKSGKNERMR